MHLLFTAERIPRDDARTGLEPWISSAEFATKLRPSRVFSTTRETLLPRPRRWKEFFEREIHVRNHPCACARAYIGGPLVRRMDRNGEIRHERWRGPYSNGKLAWKAVLAAALPVIRTLDNNWRNEDVAGRSMARSGVHIFPRGGKSLGTVGWLRGRQTRRSNIMPISICRSNAFTRNLCLFYAHRFIRYFFTITTIQHILLLRYLLIEELLLLVSHARSR